MKEMRKVIVLIPSGREYERGVLRGIIEYAHIHGPWIFYEEPPPYLHASLFEQHLAHMKAWKADGIIAHQSSAQEVKALGLPTVIVCSTHDLPATTYHLRNDNVAIGRMAADYLLSLGFKHLAYCGLHGMVWSSQRARAFSRHAARRGVKTHLYKPGTALPNEAWYGEEETLGNWLASLPKPAGLMACNDDRARMIAEICRLRNIRVPDDVSILGVDNDEHVCNRAHPPLSSVALATERAGYETAALLDRVISGKPVASHIILARPVQVISRQSTDLIAIDDARVVKALRFIRKNSNRIVTVQQVVEIAGVSRRLLQGLFKDMLGRTILDEIHQTRIQHISRMLSDTNLTIASIATAIGYEDDTHLSRFFSRCTGVTPTEYRRTYRKE